jgi:dTDP-glucose pyrophosphorylase
LRVDFKSLIVSETAKIGDALKVIDGGRLQAALVLDDAGRLKGIVTDGDVRRGLLRGIDLNSSIEKVMNNHPIVIGEAENREPVLRRLREMGMRHLPVVNDDRTLVALELIQFADFEFGAPDVALLMAGGLGKRLRPITEAIPKPMVQVGASPILEIIIRNLAQQGINRFYLSVNYKAEMIEDYFGDGAKWGVQIFYLREGEQMGTAGALSLLPERPKTPFLVMNGDIITSVNLKQMYDYHRDMNAAATVGAFAHEYQVPYGVLKMDDGRVVGIDEKPIIRKYVSAGIYILAPNVLEFVRGAEALDMPTLIERVVAGNLRVSAFPIREYWIDIGRHGDLQRASDDMQGGLLNQSDESASRDGEELGKDKCGHQ